MSHGIFREIESLIEYIPIEIDTYGIGNEVLIHLWILDISLKI